MRRFIALISLLTCAVARFGIAPQPAQADTFPAVAGMQTNHEPRSMYWNYFSQGAIGIVKGLPGESHFIMPIYWRTFPSGTRTVHVRGKLLTASASLSCDLFVYDSQGNIVSQNFALFPFNGGTGSYSWLDLSVTGVTTSTSSTLSCGISDDSNAYLMMVSYDP